MNTRWLSRMLTGLAVLAVVLLVKLAVWLWDML
jgi:hypothetical protein